MKSWGKKEKSAEMFNALGYTLDKNDSEEIVFKNSSKFSKVKVNKMHHLVIRDTEEHPSDDKMLSKAIDQLMKEMGW